MENALAPYRVRTRNMASVSENRIHSDEVARRYGFRGGLVPGVAVFAHMTRPVVEHLGPAWLAGGWAEVSFGKPAYEDELLTVSAAVDRGQPDGALALKCCNETGVELAGMRAGMSRGRADPDARAMQSPSRPLAQRPEAEWDRMTIGEPFPALSWHPAARENLDWCEDVCDDLALYREGRAPCLHPGLVLRQANNVLKNCFVLPAWIHTASRITFREGLRAERDYEVRAVPEDKWKRKGHEFVRLYVAVLAGGDVVAEILHTAIFRPREAGEAAA